MPRIILKHKSPEYAEEGTAPPRHRHCDMPHCPHNAEHKAPKHRGLNEHYWFCLDHAREYNNAWDFFSGMSAREVEDHIYSSSYGDRPTWRYASDAADALHEAARKSYFFDEEPPKERKAYNAFIDKNTAEFEAMSIMGLAPPVTFEEIKTRYKTLAKKHHPDLNNGCAKSEELLKQINMAYTILKLAFEEYRRLPDHKF